MNISKFTFCSGLWLIPGNPKRDPSHYFTHLDKTIEMISGGNLIFHCYDSVVSERVEALCKKNKVVLTLEQTPVEMLAAYQHSKTFLKNCHNMGLDAFPEPADKNREKGVLHYWRDYKGGGAEAYRRMITIWLSKIDLAMSAVKKTKDSCQDIAWIDASIARFNGVRDNWDFRRSEVGAFTLNHYLNGVRYFGKELPINASFLHARRETWFTVHELFQENLSSALKMTYAHDEETILSHCKAANPNLFVALDAEPNLLVPKIKRKLGKAFGLLLQSRSGN